MGMDVGGLGWDWEGVGVLRERLGGEWVGWGVMGVDMEGLGGH